MSIIAIDFNLVEERVGGIVGLGELLDPGIIIGLLVHELVAGECKDFETFVTIVVVDLCHPLIVTGSQASKACNVGDKGQFLASCENTDLIERFLIDVDGGNVMKR
jgi:hypothetical protein